jgi:hypothetical protein
MLDIDAKHKHTQTLYRMIKMLMKQFRENTHVHTLF